ncbi:MAG: triose-phosphate isomerase [Bacteroides sp.]|nr:triose-phosphate isomerase [Prevotella sp.]MCM1407310.1 triose-phosphate isomerase [Treponema brennaborense]MCM1469800.1 triose-phosphate isomerase [Bacteroides sp.]
MKPYYIAGNWKMNKTRTEAVALAKELAEALKDGKNKYMIAPSFTSLDAVAQVIKGTGIQLGAQNMSAEDSGAHTGEVSAAMLKDLGVSTVILGHSERRNIYREDEDFVHRKVLQALKYDLDVVLCVGELLVERESGLAEAVCEWQIRSALAGVSAAQVPHITIAYEPVWAIGTGRTATPSDAQIVHSGIRALIEELYDEEAAQNMHILYGGSMNASNAADLLAQPDIDGGLIGGAALSAATFEPICKIY